MIKYVTIYKTIVTECRTSFSLGVLAEFGTKALVTVTRIYTLRCMSVAHGI